MRKSIPERSENNAYAERFMQDLQIGAGACLMLANSPRSLWSLAMEMFMFICSPSAPMDMFMLMLSPD